MRTGVSVTLQKYMIDFLEYMEVEKGLALASVKNYHQYLQGFIRFAKEEKVEKPEEITPEFIKDYRLRLNRTLGKNNQPLSKSTQNYYLIALRSFLKYLAKKDIVTFAPEKIELAKSGERQITFLNQDELDELFSKPDLKTLQGVRDKAILNLLFSTGLRVSELCNLKKEDIDLKRSEFSVLGKGGKTRVVFLDEHSEESLEKYLNLRKDKSDFLFLGYGRTKDPKETNVSKGPITPRSVQRMVRKYAKMAGLTKKVSPHTMRHSFATDLLMSGADLRSVQSLLGHSSVTTTQVYTHLTDKHLQEVHQAFHGLRREEKKPKDNKEPSGLLG